MTKPIPGIKIPYFIADQYTVPEETTCVEIRVPAHPSFLPQLAGLVALATKAFNYKGADYAHILAIKAIWLQAYNETDWGQCMNCEELTECITPLFEAQKAEIQRMLNQSKYGDPNPIGDPLPEAERERDLAEGTNPSCDLDITWGQADQIVEYAVQLVTDVLEIAETATNDLEMLQVIGSITGLDETSIDTIFNYIALIQDAIAENYAAQVTEEYKEQAACAIFCAARENCEISLDMLYDVFLQRFNSHFSGIIPTISTIADLLAYMLDQDIDGTVVADAMHLLVFGGGALANLFLGDVGTKSLATLLALAVNDASDDWILLCSCPDVFTVPADSDPALDEYYTGFDLVEDTEYHLTATGLWRAGPSVPENDADGWIGHTDPAALVPAADLFSLCYKIGTGGTWAFAGDDLTFTAPASGTLYLAMNDVPAGYVDNTGSLSVSIVAT